MVVVEGLSMLELGFPRYPLLVTDDLQDIKDDFSITFSNDVTPMFDENDIFSGSIPSLKLTKLNAKNPTQAAFFKDLGVLKDLQTEVCQVFVSLPIGMLLKFIYYLGFL